jgi:hypothetical protein
VEEWKESLQVGWSGVLDAKRRGATRLDEVSEVNKTGARRKIPKRPSPAKVEGMLSRRWTWREEMMETKQTNRTADEGKTQPYGEQRRNPSVLRWLEPDLEGSSANDRDRVQMVGKKMTEVVRNRKQTYDCNRGTGARVSSKYDVKKTQRRERTVVSCEWVCQ